jgi:DNA-binding MarR family transcriptional regulator
MLTLKGLPAGMRPRIAELADRLQLQHHSTVELANRLSARGLVRRNRDARDRRQVLLSLTPKGEEKLQRLSLQHKAELRTQGPALVAVLQSAMQPARRSRGARA